MKKERGQEKIRNRIIGNGEEEVSNVVMNPANWRVHPKAQQDALMGVLSTIGWVQQVIINKTTGNLIDGHLRVLLAEQSGAKTVPVVYVNLSEKEESEVLATLDPVGALATADREKLTNLMRDIDTGSEPVKKMLAEMAEREGLFFETGSFTDQNTKERGSIISYLIVFDDDEQQDAWFKFLRYLKTNIVAGDTIASKLSSFILEGGYD